jgi:tetratricopeptide (TPR) repeat protein
MAYVGISQKLIEDVSRNIHMMKEKERNAFVAPPKSLELNEAPAEIVALLWGEHRHLEPVLPAKWKGKNSSVDLNFVVKDEDGTVLIKNYFTVKYDREIVVPPGVSNYRFDVELPENTCPAIPEAEAYYKWTVEMNSIELRWGKVRTQMLEFLKSCKSLNEALKLWPDVRIYIPSEYLKRVEQKTERAQDAEEHISKAAAALANIDTDAAISAAMTARLMGSMQGLK